MVAAPEFLYDQAFARNLGLVSEAEQAKLRQIRVALPGLGGVGGAHLQALARMGVGAFNLADPDAYEVVNFNRQLGATMPTVGRGKAEVMAQMARDINPEASVRTFTDGITPKNIDAFLEGVDVVVDGIEFFRIEDRRMLYRHCRAKGIPVVNAGPIGYGASVIVFTPDGPSFDEYFAINDEMTRAEQLLAFGLGLGPGLKGDMDPSRVDLKNEKGPALASACMLCAAAAATEVLKLVTGRGRPATAGHGVYFDPYRNRTLALKAVPDLKHSLRGRMIRWMAFRRFPEMQALHETEKKARESGLHNATALEPAPVVQSSTV